MEYKIIFKKRFASDLTKVVTYLETDWNKKVADEFMSKINEAISIIKSHPSIGAPSQKIKGARGILITKHNRLFYKIKKDTITVLMLADTRRRNYV